MIPDKRVIAKIHEANFEKCDSNFYSLNILSDNKVYYTLCSHDINTHGRVYVHDPATNKVELFGDLGEITKEAGKKTLPQGKSHSPIIEVNDKIYIATHYGYYQGNEGKEEPAPPPEGYFPYPGGKLIMYDRKTGDFEVLASAPPEEGIITMNMDTDRKIIYCLTWPKGIFMYYDLNIRKMEVIGQISRGGEIGLGENYFCLCRSFAIDPRDGTVYFTNPDGEILMFNTNVGKVESVRWAHMKKDIFGVWDPHKGGHQGYNWRQILWHPEHRKFFGVHGKSGFLFSFDPKEEKMEVIQRICNEVCIKEGSFESFRYGYMTLAPDPEDKNIFYYISGFNEYEKTTESEKDKATTYLTLTTYNIATREYKDHGVIQLEDGRYPSLALCIGIHDNGRIYTCPWIPRHEADRKQQCDLISFANPLKNR